ncbi:hypothetical protein Ancab_005182 [Ancistrocladus abbreviatus]
MDPLGGGDERQQQQQNRRRGMEMAAVQPQNHQQHPPHQTCPRCNSTNTKFCYYNNYSLAQPRYFCKSCRRYWTQGGTLRNVPVGGGCRKSKRPKAPSATAVAAAGATGDVGSVGASANQQLPPPVLQQDQSQEMTKQSAGTIGSSPGIVQAIGSSSLVAPPMMSPFYQGFGGGFLSSLAAIQAMSQQPPPPYNPPLGSGGSAGSLGNSSNLSLLQGINLPASFGNIQTARPPPGDWQQSVMGSANPPAPTGTSLSDARFWSIGSSSGGGGGGGSGSSGRGNDNNHAGPSSSPNQWPDFSGCGGLDDA